MRGDRCRGAPRRRTAAHPSRASTQHTARGQLSSTWPIGEALAWLDRHVNLEATAGDVAGLSLDRMRTLVAYLGDPQLDYAAVHITGTNGKGSTVALVAALAQRVQLKVGVTTSPHVHELNERLVCNGEPISDEVLAELLGHLRLVCEQTDLVPSWFELVTAAALRWFADEAVDLVVAEVGKLGSFDATNVVEAQVAVITNVGYDHTDGRPGWERAIMAEKAGIVGPDSVAVVGVEDPELVQIVADRAPAQLLVAGTDFGVEENRPAVGGRQVSVRTPRGSYEEVYVNLLGAHQGRNAALAITAFEALAQRRLEPELLESLGEVSLPARFEVLGRQPLVVVDGGHNPDGLAAVSKTLREEFHVAGGITWVVGMMRDKNPAAMLEALDVADARLVVCCTPAWPRALPAEELAEVARACGADVEVVPDVSLALDRALALSGEQDAVVVTGSMYMAGEARGHLGGH